MSLSVTVDATRLDSRIHAIKNGMQTAIKRAAKRARDHGKKKISDTVRQRVAIKASTVKQQVSGKDQGATGQVLTLKHSKRVSLRQFGARQTAKGVSYRISKSGKRGFVQSAFQGPRPGLMFTKYKGTVFKRKGKERKPIIKLWGPSVWGAFKGGKTNPDATIDTHDDLGEFFRKRLEHEVAYLISKSQ